MPSKPAHRDPRKILRAVLTNLQPAARGERMLGGPVTWEHTMLDLILLAVGVGFFALSLGYAYACDRL
jgi:hypothetical protein